MSVKLWLSHCVHMQRTWHDPCCGLFSLFVHVASPELAGYSWPQAYAITPSLKVVEHSAQVMSRFSKAAEDTT